jgi:SAM-dependent methyltransferase
MRADSIPQFWSKETRYALDYADGAFDVVTAFGVLHHVRGPGRVIAEMLRVARRAIFISDTNNYGRGPRRLRLAKVAMRTLRLWPLANFIYTAGKGYHASEGDGIAYSYSVFDEFGQIRRACGDVFILTLKGSMDRPSPLAAASHIALMGLKR